MAHSSRSWSPARFRVAVLVPLLLLVTLLAPGVEAEVYVRLFPGKEQCIFCEAVRDPDGDPTIIDVRHRALFPRHMTVRTRVYDPEGNSVTLTDRIDPYGTMESLTFRAEQTGFYRLCMRTPLSHPPLELEMRVVSENDVVAPVTMSDGTEVIDKPLEVTDYKDRLHMLDLSVEVTLDELKMMETRQHMIDKVSRSTTYRLIATAGISAIIMVIMTTYTVVHSMNALTLKKTV